MPFSISPSMQFSQLVEKFENDGFHGGDFYHLQHVQIAWHYVCSESLTDAKQKFHQGVLRLVTRLGAEDKYHCTLTDFFLDYLYQLRLYLGSDDWQQVEKHCPMLLTDAKKLVNFYYSAELLASEQARKKFVAGDRMELDRASLRLTEEEAPVFELVEYDSPLIVSMPHNGQFIPHSVLNSMQDVAFDSADTDWYMSQLYDFLDELKVTRISANYSRYLIDLNRDSSGQVLYAGADNTELCPTSTFHSEPLYATDNKPSEQEITRRVDNYWQPYHQQLKTLIQKAKAKHGYAILFEAHSIAQEVPRFFEGKLPDFNFGTNDGKTVNKGLLEVLEQFETGDYSKVINGRFKGGFITRHYAKPENNVFTIQLELSQATYMDGDKLLLSGTKQQKVAKEIRKLLNSFLSHKLLLNT